MHRGVWIMYKWSTTEFSGKQKVIDYKIVRGKPAEVESMVMFLLKSGWCVSGSLIKLRIEKQEIVVQNMVLYESEVDDSI